MGSAALLVVGTTPVVGTALLVVDAAVDPMVGEVGAVGDAAVVVGVAGLCNELVGICIAGASTSVGVGRPAGLRVRLGGTTGA